MDIIFIIALYADIQSLGRILNIYGTIYNLSIFGGGGLAGRGARLCRLIKVIQQYKASADLRKRKNQESGWLLIIFLFLILFIFFFFIFFILFIFFLFYSFLFYSFLLFYFDLFYTFILFNFVPSYRILFHLNFFVLF